ncbi:MAG: hypothetical protein KF819_19470 [Labilithrix sp.]|nr:hypothetical protein [Labilithrix sp.]
MNARWIPCLLVAGALVLLGSCADDPAEAPVVADAAVEAEAEAAAEARAPVRVTCEQPQTLTLLPPPGEEDPFRSLSPAKYQYGRCELVALLVDAARDVRAQMPDRSPVGVADLSQEDGNIPGTDVGGLRHPAPSHTNGFSADITYFRKGGKTLEDSPACPSKTREFCEGPHDLDLDATALLMSRLARTKRLVQILVDPIMEADVSSALDRLASAGAEGAAEARAVLASGIPFHADHFHVSVSRACYDGIDNDGDGKIDLDDPECDDALDDDESR